MLDGNYPVEYLNRRLQEEKVKQKKRIMWMGKFAFPKVNTKTTKLMFIPDGMHEYYFAVPPSLGFGSYISTSAPLERDTVTLGKWDYKGKRYNAMIACAYYEKRDVLLVRESAFVYEKKYL